MFDSLQLNVPHFICRIYWTPYCWHEIQYIYYVQIFPGWRKGFSLLHLLVIKSQHSNWLSKIQFMSYSINTLHAVHNVETNRIRKKIKKSLRRLGGGKRIYNLLTHGTFFNLLVNRRLPCVRVFYMKKKRIKIDRSQRTTTVKFHKKDRNGSWRFRWLFYWLSYHYYSLLYHTLLLQTLQCGLSESLLEESSLMYMLLRFINEHVFQPI